AARSAHRGELRGPGPRASSRRLFARAVAQGDARAVRADRGRRRRGRVLRDVPAARHGPRAQRRRPRAHDRRRNAMIGDAALAIWFDVDAAGKEDVEAWYPHQHLPERLSVPGFLRGRRYTAVAGGPAFFTLYETRDANVLGSAAYLERLNNPTDWTRRALSSFRGMTRNAYQRLAAASSDALASHLMTVRI